MSAKTILITGATDGADGYELNFAVNYLSQFLLITRLTGRLRQLDPAGGAAGVEELGRASAISPDSSMASRVPLMPCLVASQSANRSIQRRIASAAGQL